MGSRELNLEHFTPSLLKSYEYTLKFRNLSERTISQYISLIDKLVRCKTQENMYKVLLNNKSRSGVIALRSYLRHLIFKEILHNSILEQFTPPKRKNQKKRNYIKKERWKYYFSKGINRVHKFYLWLGFHTGMRLGELTHLRIQDIDFQEMKIYIQEHEDDESVNQRKWHPKGNRTREININDKVKRHLHNWIYSQRHYNNKGNIIDFEDDYPYIFFHPTTGRFIGERSWQRWTKETDKRTTKIKGEPKEFTAHIMRYSFAEELYKSSFNDIKYVSHVLGHSNIAITSGYLQVQDREMAEKGSRYMP